MLSDAQRIDNGWIKVTSRDGDAVVYLVKNGRITIGMTIFHVSRLLAAGYTVEPAIVTTAAELHQQPAPQAMTEAIFSYDGPAYMRPMFRGLILDQNGIDVDVSSVAPEGDYDVTIVIRPQAE